MIKRAHFLPEDKDDSEPKLSHQKLLPLSDVSPTLDEKGLWEITTCRGIPGVVQSQFTNKTGGLESVVGVTG